MDQQKVVGSCLCNAVEIHATVKTDLGACHCSMCRTWSSGPLLALECEGTPVITGEQSISRYSSSEWGERAFCSHCGSNLFYRLKLNDQHILCAGLFDLQEDEIHFDHQIFIDEKPVYYNFSEQTKNMTGEEVFAQFSDGE